MIVGFLLKAYRMLREFQMTCYKLLKAAAPPSYLPFGLYPNIAFLTIEWFLY